MCTHCFSQRATTESNKKNAVWEITSMAKCNWTLRNNLYGQTELNFLLVQTRKIPVNESAFSCARQNVLIELAEAEVAYHIIQQKGYCHKQFLSKILKENKIQFFTGFVHFQKKPKICLFCIRNPKFSFNIWVTTYFTTARRIKLCSLIVLHWKD